MAHTCVSTGVNSRRKTQGDENSLRCKSSVLVSQELKRTRRLKKEGKIMTNWVRCNEGEEKHVKNSSIYGRFGLTRNGGGGDDRDVRTT